MKKYDILKENNPCKNIRQNIRIQAANMKKIKKLLKILGPGFITGASDDDPSGIGTYSQAGAQFGYKQLWMSPFLFPLMVTIQEICGRIGMVTGKGLASVIRNYYPKKMLYAAIALLFMANTVNVGADLGAMAASGQLLVDIPFYFLLIIIATISLLLQIFVPYKAYARFLKYLTLSLLTYIAVAIIVEQPWDQIAIKTLIPSLSFSKEYMMNIVAILGTTISPYLFFWQADQEAEEDYAQNRMSEYNSGAPTINKTDIKNMRLDTAIGMLFSNLIMFFIIITTASTLHANGITTIETVDQAALALRPFAGDFAYLLFAAGIIGTGMLAVPVLAGSAAYATSEALGWKAGLNYKFKQARAFYLVISLSIILGILLNFIGIAPFKMLYYTAILNGFAAIPLLIALMFISNNKNILGEYTNGKISNIIGWIVVGIMSISAIALIVTIFV